MLQNQLKALVADHLLNCNYSITIDYNHFYDHDYKPKIILTYNNDKIIIKCNYDDKFCANNLAFAEKSKTEPWYPLLLNDNDDTRSRLYLDKDGKSLILTNYVFTIHLPSYLTKVIIRLIPYFNIITNDINVVNNINIYTARLKELEKILVNGKLTTFDLSTKFN